MMMFSNAVLQETSERMRDPALSVEDREYLNRVFDALSSTERVQADKDKAAKLDLDAAYRERNKLAALCAKAAIAMGYDAWRGKDEESTGPEWDNVLFFGTPQGQVSFHFSTTDFSLIADFELDQKKKWDGHDTQEKWRRVLESEFPNFTESAKAGKLWEDEHKKVKQLEGGLRYLHNQCKQYGLYERGVLNCSDRIEKVLAGGQEAWAEQKTVHEALQAILTRLGGGSAITNTLNLVSLIDDHILDAERRRQAEGDLRGAYPAQLTFAQLKLKHALGALKHLVHLKEVKDTQGKTPEYEQNQPLAWARAKEAITYAERSGDPWGLDEMAATLIASAAREGDGVQHGAEHPVEGAVQPDGGEALGDPQGVQAVEQGEDVALGADAGGADGGVLPEDPVHAG